MKLDPLTGIRGAGCDYDSFFTSPQTIYTIHMRGSSDVYVSGDFQTFSGSGRQTNVKLDQAFCALDTFAMEIVVSPWYYSDIFWHEEQNVLYMAATWHDTHPSPYHNGLYSLPNQSITGRTEHRLATTWTWRGGLDLGHGAYKLSC